MFDYLRNLTKSAEEKRQEQLNAYLDDTLTPQERKRFEQQLVQDAQLRADLAQLQGLKQQMRQLPRRRVPRNFILDPALYGRPRREPLVQAYPILRTATAFTALLFIFALAANLYIGNDGAFGAAESISQAIEMPVEATRVVTETVVQEDQAVEVTRVVTEIVVVEEEAEEEGAALEEQESVAEEMQVPLPEAGAVDRSANESPALTAPQAAEVASDAESVIADESVPEQEIPPPALPTAVLPVDDAGISGYPLEEMVEAEIEAYLPPEEALSGQVATAVAARPTTTTAATKEISPVPELDTVEDQVLQSRQLPLPSTMGVLAGIFGLLFLILLLLLLLARRRL